jgi:hypothetical protein
MILGFLKSNNYIVKFKFEYKPNLLTFSNIKMKNILLLLVFLTLLNNINSVAQSGSFGRSTAYNPITTAVPFLLINNDARSAGMGDAGVATSADANAMYWNAAKLAFAQKSMGFSVGYTPWLRQLVNDMNIAQLTGYYKIRKEDAIGLSFTYFNMGSIQFTDQSGNPIINYTPNEFNVAAAYSRKLSEKMGVSLSLKFIYSNLTGSVSQNVGSEVKPGIAAAADLGWFYKEKFVLQGRKTELALGANVSNLGNKMTYTNADQQDFLPTNLRVGFALTHELDAYNKVSLIADFNKLMVPSPPIYATSTTNGSYIYANGQPVILSGQSSNVPMVTGIFQSFTDAPGGFSSELKLINMSGGLEYWYNNIFALRGGFFYENPYAGGREYFTLGAGIRYTSFGVDFAYLAAMSLANPLANTLRFTLHFTFDNVGKKEESIKD